MNRIRLEEINNEFIVCLTDILETSKLNTTNEYIQHGDTSVLIHSVAVAYYSYRLALFLRIPFHKRDLIVGGLLHDYFLYDWHEKDDSHRLHGFHHPKRALQNAEAIYDLSPIERDIIAKHMFPLTIFPPTHRESVIICIVDKFCSTYETFHKGSYRKIRKACLS